jgi:SAM-dependent methyltransferase
MTDEQSLKEDLSSEKEFFDKYYVESRERPADPDMETWIEKARHPSSLPLDYWEYAFYLLGDVKDKKVLDVGCGGGWISRLLAFKGASVTAFDISLEGCITTRKKLREGGFEGHSMSVMDAHSIAFRDSTFDAVFVTGALHHLNIAKVAREVHRVLKPSGRFVCYEPLAYGPIMWAIRQVWLKINGLKEYATTEHEEGLSIRDFAPFEQMFRTGVVRPFNFIAKTNRLRHRFGPLAVGLRWIDYFVLSTVPYFRRYCTTAVCCFDK